MARKYFAFSYYAYEALGGMGDFIGTFASLDEAKRAVENERPLLLARGDVVAIEDNDLQEGWGMERCNEHGDIETTIWRRYGSEDE